MACVVSEFREGTPPHSTHQNLEPQPSAPNPEPESRNRNPKPETRNPKPETRNSDAGMTSLELGLSEMQTLRIFKTAAQVRGARMNRIVFFPTLPATDCELLAFGFFTFDSDC